MTALPPSAISFFKCLCNHTHQQGSPHEVTKKADYFPNHDELSQHTPDASATTKYLIDVDLTKIYLVKGRHSRFQALFWM